MANGEDHSSANHTSILIEEKSDILNTLKATMSAKLRPDSPMFPTSCIFRVPQLLRRHNEEAYQPLIVSIGPLHRGGEQFQSIEIVKQWYLYNLLSSMNISLQIFIDRIDKFLEQRKEGIIDRFEQHARSFYAEPLHHINRNDFIEMMILDGCFLIQLFRNFIHGEHKNLNVNDPIFNMDCMFQHICHDLLLLENQIPWFVLECLYAITRKSYPHDPSLQILMLTVFTSQPPLAHSCKFYAGYLLDRNDHDDDEMILHILDLIRTSIVFPFKEFVPSDTKYKKCLWINKKPNKKYGSEIPPAATLSQAGIKFESGSLDSESMMNIQFNRGVLTVPHLEIGELTEPLFRNLIAFEQCYHGRSHHITSYAVLMDKLLGSSRDMEFLCEKRIIGTWLSVTGRTLQCAKRTVRHLLASKSAK